MSFTYTQLKTAIQDYCQNSESSFVAHLNDFIISAEDKIFSAVQMAPFWKSDSSSVTASGTAEYTAAAGSLDIFSVRVGEAAVATGAETVEDGPVRYLLRKDYDFLLEAYPGSSTAKKTGVPKYYAVSSASITSDDPTLTIRLGPIPDAIYPMTIDYYGKASTDSLTEKGDAGLTWLSSAFPQVLLHGCLVEAYTYMKGEPDLIQLYQSQFQEGIGMMKNFGEGRQNSDGYIDGTKRVPSQ